MSVREPAEAWSKCFQGLSLLGLSLVPLLIFRTMVSPPVIEPQSQFIGLIFITICLLGGIAGIRPSACSLPLSFGAKQEDLAIQETLPQKKSARRGHHYQCEGFSTHVLIIGENVFCAGCTGLSTGAAIAILGSFLYFFIGIPLNAAELTFWIGFAGAATGILQHNIYRVLGNTRGSFRFMLNVFFVVGAFLLLIGADQLAGSAAVDSYILLIVLFWIYTRISMSNSEHRRICSQCDMKVCQDSE
jgi:hypothetical protein